MDMLCENCGGVPPGVTTNLAGARPCSCSRVIARGFYSPADALTRIAVSGLPLETQVANLVEHVRAQYGRIAALEAEVAGLKKSEQMSREP